jgi:dihydroorotase
MNKYTLYQKHALNQSNKNIFKIGMLLLSLILFHSLEAQEIDILLKGGHVIDPKNKIDTVIDIAITGNKISQVARNIPVNNAKKVIDVKGLYVTPGDY